MSAGVGAPAPDFALPSQDWETVTLRQILAGGHVVLAFFPAAFSSTCTSELCTLRDGLAGFTASGVQVVGISVDSPFALKAYRQHERLPFPLLSDFNKDVIRAYGVFCDDMIGLRGLAKRAVVLVDRGGVIRYQQVLEDARDEPDYRRLEEAAAALG